MLLYLYKGNFCIQLSTLCYRGKKIRPFHHLSNFAVNHTKNVINTNRLLFIN